MSEPTESAILAALAKYREHISQVNHRAFSIMIPQIDSVVPERQQHLMTSEDISRQRIRFLCSFIGLGSHDYPLIERPSNLLDHWDSLAPLACLDGASVDDDFAWRDTQRHEYVTGILEGLQQFPCPTGEWYLPRDLTILMQHVDSVEGPGWFSIRFQGHLILWEGWGWIGDKSREKARSRVASPQEIEELVPKLNYEISTGWECGSGNEMVCWAIYSRPRGREQNQSWSWRYLVFLGDSYGHMLFENIVEVLDWYKSFQEPTERHMDISAQAVFES